jgi:hypothetical protein
VLRAYNALLLCLRQQEKFDSAVALHPHIQHLLTNRHTSALLTAPVSATSALSPTAIDANHRERELLLQLTTVNVLNNMGLAFLEQKVHRAGTCSVKLAVF